MEKIDTVHCLVCDHVWHELIFLDKCPNCGNEDTNKTVYLIHEEEKIYE